MNKQKIRNLISENNLEKAIDCLLTLPRLIDDDSIYNELLLHKAKFEKYQKDIRNGLISREQAELMFNRLNKDILSFIGSIPDPTFKEEANHGERTVEILLNGRVEEFSSEKKDDLIKMLSVMLKVSPQEIHLNRIHQKNEDTLALRISSVKVNDIINLINSNHPQIEKLKESFNIQNAEFVKDFAIKSVKKTMNVLLKALIIGFVAIIALSFIVYYILDYLDLLPLFK